MRILLATLAVLIAASVSDTAQADPYRWCANYSGRGGGAQNCYFVTIQQCQAAISGNGGWCTPNLRYGGLPVTTPEDGFRHPRRRS
jgi:hypothetical protein